MLLGAIRSCPLKAYIIIMYSPAAAKLTWVQYVGCCKKKNLHSGVANSSDNVFTHL